MSYDLDERPLFRSSSPHSPASPARRADDEATRKQPPVTPTEPKKLDLSLTQLVGGALAAMTAAALGSRLGLAGTVIGAALASLVAGVGGALYTASLRRTRQTVQTVWRWRPVGGRTAVTPAVDAEAGLPAVRFAGVSSAVQPLRPVPEPAAPHPTRRRLWPRVLAGTLASFALAGAALTSVELLTGHALSGGSGTTIEQVGTGGTRATTTDRSSTDDEPATEPSDAGQPTGSASTAPSAEPTPAPSASEAAPSESAATPTPEPSASASSEPSAPATTDPGAARATTETTQGGDTDGA